MNPVEEEQASAKQVRSAEDFLQVALTESAHFCHKR